MELGEHGLLGYEGRRIDVDPEFVVATAYTLALELMRTGRDMRDDVLAEAE
jgi:heat shock protein HspQ